MTKPTGPARIGKAKRVVRILSDLVQSLPTASDKREVHDSLQSVTSYLQEAQRQLAAIPTQDDFRHLDEALQRLERLLTLAEDNPMLAKSLGLTHKRAARMRRVHPLSDERVASIVQELEAMTIDQVRQALTSGPKYSTSDLRALATHLGVRLQSRMSRETLANHITTSVANTRGYKQLSGDSFASQQRGRGREPGTGQ